jgi:hypothetical protein
MSFTPLQSYKKDPAATLDYTMNWAPFCGPDDDIADASLEIQPGITYVTAVVANKQQTVWLTGGTLGLSYTVTYEIETVLGRKDRRTIVIVIEKT